MSMEREQTFSVTRSKAEAAALLLHLETDLPGRFFTQGRMVVNRSLLTRDENILAVRKRLQFFLQQDNPLWTVTLDSGKITVRKEHHQFVITWDDRGMKLNGEPVDDKDHIQRIIRRFIKK